MLGTFEIWLSTDGETWWSLGPIDGTTLSPGTGYAVAVGSQARYVAFVLPGVSGQPQVGGIGEVRIWPADQAPPLSERGAPLTPTPVADAAALPTEPPATEEAVQSTDPPAASEETIQPTDPPAEDEGTAPEQTAEPTPSDTDG
jgi:hypothetical protein